MVFDTWEQGEAFYKNYAHHVGFSVRKAPHHKYDGGVLLWKRFFFWLKARLEAGDRKGRRAS
jgi:hypothetical protein